MICECVYSLLVASHHFNATREYNEFNPGIIIQRKDNAVFYAYVNSYKRATFGFGYRYNFRVGQLPLAVVPAIVSGYNSPVSLSLVYSTGKHNIHFIPPIRNTFVVAYSFNL